MLGAACFRGGRALSLLLMLCTRHLFLGVLVAVFGTFKDLRLVEVLVGFFTQGVLGGFRVVKSGLGWISFGWFVIWLFLLRVSRFWLLGLLLLVGLFLCTRVVPRPCSRFKKAVFSTLVPTQ